VSENDNCHCADTTNVAVNPERHGKERLKRKALRWPRKTRHRGCTLHRPT